MQVNTTILQQQIKFAKSYQHWLLKYQHFNMFAPTSHRKKHGAFTEKKKTKGKEIKKWRLLQYNRITFFHFMSYNLAPLRILKLRPHTYKQGHIYASTSVLTHPAGGHHCGFMIKLMLNHKRVLNFSTPILLPKLLLLILAHRLHKLKWKTKFRQNAAHIKFGGRRGASTGIYIDAVVVVLCQTKPGGGNLSTNCAFQQKQQELHNRTL